MRAIIGVDEVLLIPTGRDWRGAAQLATTVKRLRAKRYEVAIDFSSPAYKWLPLLAGVPTRTYMKFDRGWWFIPGKHTRWRGAHAAEHYYDCAEELDLPPWREADLTARLRLPNAARREAKRYLDTHGIVRGKDRLIAIHPGGAMLDGVKRWPAERYARLADALRERWDARILLFGGPDEAELVAEVARAMRGPSLQVAGDLSLMASLAVIASCALFIGNDSGLLHSAAALGTPFVGVYGPTAVANFHPMPRRPGQGVVITPHAACRSPQYFIGGDVVWSRPCCEGVCDALASVSVERVLAVASPLLRRELILKGAATTV
ncbi:MAG: glycosyltransferase family 9 protein [Ktedonobacterales bacterium]